MLIWHWRLYFTPGTLYSPESWILHVPADSCSLYSNSHLFLCRPQFLHLTVSLGTQTKCCLYEYKRRQMTTKHHTPLPCRHWRRVYSPTGRLVRSILSRTPDYINVSLLHKISRRLLESFISRYLIITHNSPLNTSCFILSTVEVFVVLVAKISAGDSISYRGDDTFTWHPNQGL